MTSISTRDSHEKRNLRTSVPAFLLPKRSFLYLYSMEAVALQIDGTIAQRRQNSTSILSKGRKIEYYDLFQSHPGSKGIVKFIVKWIIQLYVSTSRRS